jgi:hypothetical protein
MARTLFAWRGTPNDVATLARAIHEQVLPEGEFSARVVVRDGHKWEADAPDSLREMPVKEAFARLKSSRGNDQPRNRVAMFGSA